MSRRDVARNPTWPGSPGFTVSMAPEVARRQLRVSLGLMVGVAAVMLALAASTWAAQRGGVRGEAHPTVVAAKS